MDTEKFRIYLRALEIEDYKKIHEWRKDPVYQAGVVSMKRFISSETEKKWVESVIARHEKNQEIRLAIVLKSSNEPIGMIWLTEIDLINRNAKIGFFIGESGQRKKGFVQEARFLMYCYAFQDLSLERVWGMTLENNFASRNSSEKFGLVKEGKLRNAVFKDGKFNNLIVYSMLKDEFYQKFNL